MKVETDIKELWTCPNCQRQFERQGQMHSCKVFPIEQHFEGKPAGTLLYEKLKEAVAKQLGSLKVESLECCIHFVHTSTFLAVKILGNKLQIDFSLGRKMEHKRIVKFTQMSAHRYLYYVDILTETDIDDEVLAWIKEAYELKDSQSIKT
jgi:CRISPR/Cas system-associated exonuclease Cas4 (RecB family)